MPAYDVCMEAHIWRSEDSFMEFLPWIELIALGLCYQAASTYTCRTSCQSDQFLFGTHGNVLHVASGIVFIVQFVPDVRVCLPYLCVLENGPLVPG